MLSFPDRLRIVACEVSIVTYFTGYVLAEKGFLCSDIGKNSIDDVKSCEAALNVIQKVNPDVRHTPRSVAISAQAYKSVFSIPSNST